MGRKAKETSLFHWMTARVDEVPERYWKGCNNIDTLTYDDKKHKKRKKPRKYKGVKRQVGIIFIRVENNVMKLRKDHRRNFKPFDLVRNRGTHGTYYIAHGKIPCTSFAFYFFEANSDKQHLIIQCQGQGYKTTINEVRDLTDNTSMGIGSKSSFKLTLLPSQGETDIAQCVADVRNLKF